jgi:hypothetical protein
MVRSVNEYVLKERRPSWQRVGKYPELELPRSQVAVKRARVSLPTGNANPRDGDYGSSWIAPE